MRLHIRAVGRVPGRAPERALIDDYRSRAAQTGRALGWADVSETEVDERKASGMAAEAAALQKALPEAAVLICLDERGALLSSPEFATRLQGWAEQGRRDIVFMIGGADGLDPALRARADLVLSFGQMVWPHKLARVMLAEQIYRAATILAGGPYHRV